MKSETQIKFRRKELMTLLDDVKQYDFSENEQERIKDDIKILEWVLRDDIKPNKYLR